MEGKVVVLGSGGYLGGALSRELGRRLGSDRLILSRGIEDLAAQGIPVRAGDTVVNTAGYYGRGRARLHAANVDHAARAAACARDAGAALVHVSSSAVFDGIRRGRVDERTPLCPRSEYARSKAHAEAMVVRVHPEARIVRPSKLFGGDDPRGRLRSLFHHVRKGRPLPLPGRPPLWANFVWVVDAARVLAGEVLDPGGDQVIHLATPAPWEEFAGLLGSAAGRPVRRAPQAAELAASVVTPVLATVPDLLPRQVERLLELWDRREFADGEGRFPAGSLASGLAEVGGAVR